MTLPQNVKDAVRSIDDSETVAATPHPDWSALVKIISVDDWQIISAHLLSQAAEIADLIGKRDFLLRHYNLAESRLAAANALLRFMRTRFDAYMDDSDRAAIDAALQEGEG